MSPSPRGSGGDISRLCSALRSRLAAEDKADEKSPSMADVTAQARAGKRAQEQPAVHENLTATDFALTLNPGGSYWQHQGLLQTPFP